MREKPFASISELALDWYHSQHTIIGEFSGSIREETRELNEFVRDHVNPLLVKHGHEPIEFTDIYGDAWFTP